MIPPDALKAEGLGEGDEVILQVRTARRLEDLFGLFMDKRLDAQADGRSAAVTCCGMMGIQATMMGLPVA